MTGRRLIGGLAAVALAAAVALSTIALARRDRVMVPAWRLGTAATEVQVQRLADTLGIPGEVRRRPGGGWVAEEGGVRLTVRPRPGLPWSAGHLGALPLHPSGAERNLAIALEVAHDVGAPAMQLVERSAVSVTLRPMVAGGVVSAMPWRFLFDGGRLVAVHGWLARPVPVFVTRAELVADDALLPRRRDDGAR